jgi:steroid delta-isomerase-like uncharacterized protein
MKKLASVMFVAGALALAAGACKSEEKQPAKPKADKPKADAPKPPPPKPLTADERIAKVRDCFAKLNAKDPAFDNCFTKDAMLEIAGAGPTGTGPALDVINGYRAAFPDLKGTNLLTLASGNKVVSLDLMQGTNTGPLMGMEPTGKSLGIVAAHVWETNDQGQATKEWAFVDQATMMGQLGQHKQPHREAVTEAMEAGPTAASTGSETEAANVKLIDDYYAAFNAHDLTTMAGLFADDAEEIDMTMPKDMRGAKANADLMGMYFKGFPDANCTANWKFGAGDYAVSQWTCKGTNTGAMKELGIKKATGKAVAMEGLDVFQFAGGKIAKHWNFYNGMSMAMQLGLMEAPAAPAKDAPAPAAKPASKGG